jgi:two-component system, cell cycle sensor histidine kinase and response regulator CckA
LGANLVQKEVTVLVVDDESLMLNLIGSLLQRTRFAPISAGDMVQARRICEAAERPIDIVLCDVGMAKPGREAFWTSLRNRFPEARVVFMSGFPEDQVELPEWTGRRLFLEKPFPAAKLVSTLEWAAQTVKSAGGS